MHEVYVNFVGYMTILRVKCDNNFDAQGFRCNLNGT
jgi:hypothetical protein